MLTATEVMQLMASGQPLPQEQFGNTSEDVIGEIQAAEVGVLNALLQALEDGEDAIGAALRPTDLLIERYGWFPACAILTLAWVDRIVIEAIPSDLLSGREDATTLLAVLTLAAEHTERYEGVWTIPMAMLASLGPEEAREFTAFVVFCVGYCALTETAEQ